MSSACMGEGYRRRQTGSMASASWIRRIVPAGARIRTEVLGAFLARDRAAADDAGEEIISKRLDLALLQDFARRQRGRPAADLGFGHPVATLVGIRALVEMRHRGPRNAALDHGNELVAAELALPQIGGAAGRLW